VIYFIHAPAMDAVKIGFAGSDPRRRLTLLQTGSPCELKLLAVQEGDKAKEKELHVRFAEFRTRREWFSYGKPIAEYVASLDPVEEPKRERFVTDIAEQCGISKAYASQILSGQRSSIEVMLHVFATAGWKHPSFDGADETTLRLLSDRFPYRKTA
jgi:hypothetical protein